MFKRYNKKRNVGASKNVTLDRKHKQMIKKFEKEKSSLPTKKNKLKRLKKKLEKTEKSFSLNEEDFNTRFVLQEEIEALEREIEEIEKGKSEIDYFLKTSDLLFPYYEQEEVTEPSGPSKVDAGGVLSYFCVAASPPKEETVVKKSRHRRGSISKLYFQSIDPDNYQQSSKVDRLKCIECGIERMVLQSQGLVVCQTTGCSQCGVSEEVVLDAKKTSYKDPPPEVSYYAYQRKNHFLEILAQFQAKESTNIPEDVFIQLKEEIRKERLKNLAKLNYKQIKRYLKKLGLARYYEHIPYIRFKLTGQPAPQFSPEVERKLILMFDMAQAPFEKICPLIKPQRDNFLNYRYVLYKFVELLGMHEYKKYLPLLKNRERLLEQDHIWRGICEEIQNNYPEWRDVWVFYPSV